MNAISYSLFGYGKERQENCFDFNSYLRGLMINLRMNRLIYPGWLNIIHVDAGTGALLHEIFKNPVRDLKIEICEDAPLTLAMLWRLKPIFEMHEDKTWKYEHVICRDLDSPTTYREAQAVQHWINNDKAMHAITDSISHNLPLMGGMIGINPRYFTERVAQKWDHMISKALHNYYPYDWSRKGTDQTFLNDFVYPAVARKGAESITQHYILGHGNTFLNDWYNAIPDLELPNVPLEMKESNDVCGHIGAAGYYGPPMFKFLQKHKEHFIDLLEIEKSKSEIFNWCLDGTFE